MIQAVRGSIALAILLAVALFVPASAQTTTSAQLDASGHFSMPALPSMGAPITIEAWVNPKGWSDYGRIVELNNGGFPNDSILITYANNTSTTKPTFWLFYGTDGSFFNVEAPNPIPVNAWSHIAGTLDSNGTMRLFVNGIQVASGTAPKLPNLVARNSNWIGVNSNLGSRLNGSIADVRVWSTARTQAQIQAAMPVGSITGATTGLVAAYPFGATGQAVLNDVSGNNRTLTPSGTVLYQTAGPASPLPGPAVDVAVAELNGAGSFSLPALPAMGGVFTVEAWVNPKSQRNYGRIVDLGNDGYPNNNILLMYADGPSTKPVFWVFYGTDGSFAQVTAPNPIPLNTWSHIAGSIEANGTMRLFVNGLQVATTTAPQAAVAVARNACRIGRTHDLNEANPIFNGSIADVRIWNTPRTQAQIQATMPVGSITGPATGLVAAYPFGHTGQPALNDVSGNNRTLIQAGEVNFRSLAPTRFSAQLGGSGHLAMPTLSTVSLPITIESWVFPTALVSWARSVDLGDGNGTMINLLASSDSSGRPSLHVLSGWGDAGAIVATNALPLNTWTHLAGVIGADRSMKLYVNGVEAASAAAPGVPASYNLVSNRIGLDNYSGTTFFKGSIGDVRVWNTARTQAQIQANMAAGSISSAVTGLLGAYPFGATGQPTLNDVSGNNRTLTASGAVQFQILGPSSPTAAASDSTVIADLKGSGYYTLPTFPALRDFTIEAWVNPRGLQTYGRIVDLGNAGYPNDNLLLMFADVSATKPVFWVFYGTDNTFFQVTAPDPIPLNAWSHIAGTIDSSGVMRVFVNGRQVASGTAPRAANLVARSSNRIGAHSDLSGIFNGSIADVRIWNYARTEAQIQSTLPVGSISGPAVGLMAAYPFGSTGSEVLADISLSSRTLTQFGSPEYRKTGSGFLAAQGFQGSASLVTSAGQLTLPGNNAYTGTTTIGGGALQVGAGGTAGSLGTGNVANNGILTFNRSDNFTVPNAISGSGYLFKQGAGALTLSGANSFTGGLTVQAGSVALTGGIANNATNTITVNNGATFSINRNSTFGGHDATAVTPFVVQSGAVLQGGDGFVNVMGPITLRGGTLRTTSGRATANGWSFVLRGGVTVDGGAVTSVLEGPGMALGATSVANGTFDVADGSAADDLVVTGGLLNGPASAFPNMQASGLVKTGTGRMTLTGANAYTGTTTISAGTLQVGNGGTTGTLGTGNVVNNATLTFNRSDAVTVPNAISGSGSLFKQGTGGLTLSGNSSFTGGMTIESGSVALTGDIANNAANTITVNNGATFSINRNSTFGGHDTTAVTPFVVQSGAVLQAGDGFFNVMGPITLRGGTLRTTSGRATANGWSFVLRGGVTVDGGAVTSVLEGPGMALGATSVANGTFDVADGSAADDLVVTGGLINGPASAFPNMQASGLVKTGTGRMTLTGANAYTGTTTISAGTLQVGNGGTTGTLGTGNVVNNATLTFNRSDVVTVANAITGTGGITQQGVGTLALTGANTYSGISTVSAGTLQVGNGGTIGTLGTGNVVNNAALVFHRTDTYTVANAISGSGTVTVQGGGIMALTGANTYSGVSTVTAGTLQVGNGGTTGSLGTGNVVNNSTLSFNRSDNIVVGNVISGTGGLRKLGGGTVTLSAGNTFSGPTVVAAGTLALGSAGTLGTSSGITISGGAALDVTARSSGLVVASGRTLANASGTATLRGNVQATAGTLSLASDGTNPSFTIANGALTLAANTPVVVTTTGSAWVAGMYKLVAKGAGGSVAGVAPSAVTFSGAGAGGVPSALSIVDGELMLRVGTPVSVALGNLAQEYNGTPRPVSVTTTPSDRATIVTYNGSTTVPTGSGSYAVVATVNAPGFFGSASGTLVVSKGKATIKLGNLLQSYDGTARRVSALTTPPGLPVSITYTGRANAPTNVGAYPVLVTVSHPNYAGSITGMLLVRPSNPGERPAANPLPPSYLNHQGFLSDANGNPLGAPNPKNYDIIFRVFSAPIGGSALWAEQQAVTLDQGRYSVMLGNGLPMGVEPWPSLEAVLASGPGAGRYLQVTVRGLGIAGADVVMMPRLQIVSQPYAFLVRHAQTADALVDSNGIPIIRVSGGSVGVNVERPTAALAVGGTLTATTMTTPGNIKVSGALSAKAFVGRGTIPIGGIVVWSGTTPPAGWAICDGTTASGRRTPDLRGRFVLSQGNATGLTPRVMGQTGGAEAYALSTSQIGLHSHFFDPPAVDLTDGGAHEHGYESHSVGRGNTAVQISGPPPTETKNQWVTENVGHSSHKHSISMSATSSTAGGGQPHNTLPPFYVLAYIMRVQ